MTVKSIKTELYKLIDDIDDKNLLCFLKEEIQTYTSQPQTDILDNLTEIQLTELETAIKGSEQKEEVSLKEYKKLTDRWRIK